MGGGRSRRVPATKLGIDAWWGLHFQQPCLSHGPNQGGRYLQAVQGQKGVLFGIFGVFTPGCSKTHLPVFGEQAKALQAKGVQVIACLDECKVRLLSNSTGTFGKETDSLLDDPLVSIFGNHQLKSFSIGVEDGIVRSPNMELEGTGVT
ncbi:unnamed protein product [Nyctereutes procyonoides]|uniref:thioredoxin-dependent peroxiredoxin n=1 Tax=Nyctereutes procyonoides TaxID=34880 RepID=A0A811ZQV4_NYCPR|nr:unnamed protein product [Nyctereutes procyonoides]